MLQLTHHNSKFIKQRFPITLVCHSITLASNVGGLVRIGDAFGIQEILFCGEHFMVGKRALRSSRNAEKFVSYKTLLDIQTALNQLKPTHTLIALEITKDSQALQSCSIPLNKPIALVIGNENYGISDAVLRQCHQTVHITMYGENSSMNVVQATSIALYELTKRLQ